MLRRCRPWTWLSLAAATIPMALFSSTVVSIAAQEPSEPSATCSDSAASTVEATIEKHEDRLVVKLDGEVVTEYLIRSGAKPVLWPLFGPSGQELTRAYPLRATPGAHERDDHIHQRSVWFTHGDVNGISFWHEQDAHGTIVHREFVETSEGEVATIASVNDWLGPDGDKVCEDQRRFIFGREGAIRWIDVEVTVTASDGPVTFGDTKEGTFGVRVAGSMKVDEKLGGRIESSEGLVDGQTWGKPARWVDYSGPIGETTAGITIMNHPRSYGYPTHWHVRSYGLFAANPFGLHDFYAGEAGHDGTLKLAAGESFMVRYRMLLHDGPLDAAATEAMFRTWAEKE